MIVIFFINLFVLSLSIHDVEAAQILVRIPEGTSVSGCEYTNSCFIPFEIKIQKGDTIVWNNEDSGEHTVTSGTSQDGPTGEFDSSLFPSGSTFSHIFEESGTIPYFCMVHPWMKGVVIIGDGISAKEKNSSSQKPEQENTKENLEDETTKDSSLVEKKPIPSFVDPHKDPWSYVQRYQNEIEYKKWFDNNFPDYTIYQAVGLKEPLEFVDPEKDPQYYLDRYFNETEYKKWFDSNFPDYTIYEAIGIPEPIPEIDPCWADFRERNEAIMKSYYEAGDPDGGLYASQKLYRQFTEKCSTSSKQETDPVNQQKPVETALTNDTTKLSGSGGGCLIATAAFGSELSSQVQQLRELRDNHLLQTESGSAFLIGFNELYYSFSPTIADLERENQVFKEVVKLTITPLLTSLSILNYVNLDSEEEVLGYGIGIILLNIGMYFVAPTVLLLKLKKMRIK